MRTEVVGVAEPWQARRGPAGSNRPCRLKPPNRRTRFPTPTPRMLDQPSIAAGQQSPQREPPLPRHRANAAPAGESLARGARDGHSRLGCGAAALPPSYGHRPVWDSSRPWYLDSRASGPVQSVLSTLVRLTHSIDRWYFLAQRRRQSREPRKRWHRCQRAGTRKPDEKRRKEAPPCWGLPQRPPGWRRSRLSLLHDRYLITTKYDKCYMHQASHRWRAGPHSGSGQELLGVPRGKSSPETERRSSRFPR
jgi:hypothetical protein